MANIDLDQDDYRQEAFTPRTPYLPPGDATYGCILLTLTEHEDGIPTYFAEFLIAKVVRSEEVGKKIRPGYTKPDGKVIEPRPYGMPLVGEVYQISFDLAGRGADAQKAAVSRKIKRQEMNNFLCACEQQSVTDRAFKTTPVFSDYLVKSLSGETLDKTFEIRAVEKQDKNDTDRYWTNNYFNQWAPTDEELAGL